MLSLARDRSSKLLNFQQIRRFLWLCSNCMKHKHGEWNHPCRGWENRTQSSIQCIDMYISTYVYRLFSLYTSHYRQIVEQIYRYYSYLQIFKCLLCTHILHGQIERSLYIITNMFSWWWWWSDSLYGAVHHINAQEIVFVWSANEAKITDPPVVQDVRKKSGSVSM